VARSRAACDERRKHPVLAENRKRVIEVELPDRVLSRTCDAQRLDLIWAQPAERTERSRVFRPVSYDLRLCLRWGFEEVTVSAAIRRPEGGSTVQLRRAARGTSSITLSSGSCLNVLEEPDSEWPRLISEDDEITH
jgi:hypothetical protein